MTLKTEEEMSAEFFDWMLSEAQDYEWAAIASITIEKDLVLLQHSFGRSICDHYRLHEQGLPDPTATAYRILTGAWQRLKAWEALSQ